MSRSVSQPPAGFSLSAGRRLGRYEILAPLGAGGMGEVYRARDPDLKRDVALKVLHRGLSGEAEHVARFKAEAWAASRLEHDNIVRVLDVGVEAGIPYVVSELLEGEALRERLLRGPIPYPRALEWGSQIAQALGAAHEKGICHRDVKPENIFITSSGRLKLLDFGLAKLTEAEPGAHTEDSTADATQSGAIRGTAAYMSPEQVRGEPVDARSDLFGLGAVLYEMFTGQRAFRRGHWVETMHAVMNDDPPDPLELNPALPEAAATAVRRCLEKAREQRFQSARDLAFHLQQLQRLARSGSRPAARDPASRRQRLAILAMAAVTMAALIAALAVLLRTSPRFERLTFSHGRIDGARLTPDGRAVFYSEARADSPPEVRRLDLAEKYSSQRIGYDGANLLAVRDGALALSIDRRFDVGERFRGTLAEAVLGGGPRAIKGNVEHADWGRQGIAAAFSDGGRSWLEYPIDTSRYAPEAGSILYPRVSPDERYIAFVHDLKDRGFGGRIAVLELASGRVTPLTGDFPNLRGLAWSSDGRQLWFAAGEWRRNRALHVVDLRGSVRLAYEAPGSITLWDVAQDAVLFARDDERKVIMGVAPGETVEHDFSWRDASGIAGLSRDGREILFAERDGIYARPTRWPSEPVKLAELREPADLRQDQHEQCCGFADDLLPDASRYLATYPSLRKLVILSRESGAEQPLPPPGPEGRYRGALWFPDGRRVLVRWKAEGRQERSYVQDLQDHSLRPLAPEGVKAMAISADGGQVAAGGAGGVTIWDVASGTSRTVAGTGEADRPTAWTPDGRSLWVWQRREDGSARVFKLEIATGRRRVFLEKLRPPDPAGVWFISEFHITPRGDSYFYSCQRVLSQLYIVRGLRY